MTFTACLLICAIFALVMIAIGFVKYSLRGKYAEYVRGQPDEKREKIIAVNKRLLKYYKILVWVSLISLILVPIGLYFTLDVNLWVAISFPALLLALVYQEYAFRKWLLGSL